MRVRDLANELGVPNNAVLEILKEHGIELFSHMSSIDVPHVELVRNRLQPKKKAVVKKDDKRIGKRVIRRRKVDDAVDDADDDEDGEPEPDKSLTTVTSSTRVLRRSAKNEESADEVAARTDNVTEAQEASAVSEPAPAADESSSESAAEKAKPVSSEGESADAVAASEPASDEPLRKKPKTVVVAAAKAARDDRANEGQQNAADGGDGSADARDDGDSGARIIKTGVKIHERPPRAPGPRGPGGPRSGPPGARGPRPMGGPGRPIGGPRPLAAAVPPAPGEDSEDRKRAKKKKETATKDVKRPKLRVVTKTDKYRQLLGDGSRNARGGSRKKKKGDEVQSSTVPMSERKRKIRIEESILVGDLAKQMGVKASDIVKKFIELGMMVTVNQSIDPETATIVASEYNFEVEVTHQTEEEILAQQATEERDEDLSPRPPVVTVMGHVDHGKTSILDAIRSARVAAGEAGGITQHIGAYQIERNGKQITFIDTPGHAAFTAMRARGAKVTDLVVLVVAANDGVMPQTLEAIQHAQSANVPMIVAINKMDVEGANPDKVMQRLSEHNVVPEAWGGDTIFVRCSAIKNEGIEDLIDSILLQSEVLDLKANPKRDFAGVVLEASLDKGRGPMATILVTQGKLKVGAIVMVDKFYGRVRSLTNDLGQNLKEALPGTPVALQGLNGVPSSGDVVQEVKNERTAKDIVERRRLKERETELARRNKITIEDLFSKDGTGEVRELNLLIKGDVHGSVEALRDALEGLSTAECKVRTVFSGVGAITENDVNLASASSASIIGFNIRADSKTSRLAEQLGVEIRPYSIIYEVIDDIRKAMLGLLAPEEREENLGWVRVKEIFPITGIGTIAGSMVETGKVVNGCGVRLIREGKVIYEGKVENLRRFKDNVKEVLAGQECGILLRNHNDVVIGDEMETFHVLKIARTEL